ncbi:MAG: hypothetical protein ACUVXA_01535 [Candidatus Jordarchaeum sp.]|uniref:hypothetical protein n=1 Tax=Candidatus Jordarchaeum sp. TaxID=2823881 RepID=UPI00404AE2F4
MKPKNNHLHPILLLTTIPIQIQINFWDYTGIIRALITATIAIILFLIYVITTRKTKTENQQPKTKNK